MRSQRYHIHANLSLAVLLAQILLLISFCLEPGTVSGHPPSDVTLRPPPLVRSSELRPHLPGMRGVTVPSQQSYEGAAGCLTLGSGCVCTCDTYMVCMRVCVESLHPPGQGMEAQGSGAVAEVTALAGAHQDLALLPLYPSCVCTLSTQTQHL